MNRSLVTHVLTILGLSCLFLGALSGDYAWAGDYDSEFSTCVENCQKSNGAPYGSIEEGYVAECNKYQNVSCSTCVTCPGGPDTPCTSTGNNCGDLFKAAFCNNGLCVCRQAINEDIGGKTYSCFCFK